MKNLIFLIGIFFLTNVLLAQQASIDSKAPDFKLKDSYGKEYSLNEFKGKTVVLEWINYDCPFVKKHYDSKNMQQLQEKYTQKGVVWLAICSSAKGKQGHFTNDEINKRSKEHGAKFTAYLIDEDGTVGKMYGAKTTPHMFIINSDGKLVYAGAIDDIKSTDKEDVKKANNYVSKALDEILSGKEVSTKTTTPYGCSVKY
ncbi:MAG: thioredoxin family protein [Ignavibacterium sp.]|nr:thioredoxin family protein [Ignavibacterium sp.]MDW8376294.1 thioredoxin family protein [Ignavibacteriales bacterium]